MWIKQSALGIKYRVTDRRVALRHRLSIGTIVSDPSMVVRYASGKNLGTIEQYFIAQLNPGDVFWFAGRKLELVRIKDMEAIVRNTKRKSGRVPSWQRGRMALSSQLSDMIRRKVNPASEGRFVDEELRFLRPLLDLQATLSHLPGERELLVEYFQTEEGHHVVVYPFEGRLVHEAMAAILAYRISHIRPITFSFGMNDYGFELLSDQPIPVDDTNVYELFSPDDLLNEIQRSVNSTEMARRKIRDVVVIGGLIFQGMPGEKKK